MTLLAALIQARREGLTVDRDGDQLTIRGPRSTEHIVRQLLARKPDVFALVAIYNGRAQILDWHAARLAPAGTTCPLCGGAATLLDPYDWQPVDKVCAEKALTSTSSTGAAA